MHLLPDELFMDDSRWWVLTPRERQILNFLLSGRSNKWTAYELGISQRTVECHRSNIYRKYGVRSAMQLLVALQREFPGRAALPKPEPLAQVA